MRAVEVCCVGVLLLAGCSGSGEPRYTRVLAPPLPTPPGGAPADAQQQQEAQQLEVAEAKCASQGMGHAVAQRNDGLTTYSCVPRGENQANPPADAPKPQ
jgi:hypothetical protein